MRPKLIVWYNTKCPVCNGGIKWQDSRLLRAAQAGAVEFRDINLEPAALARFGAGIEDVRRRLHGVDAEGRLFIGADCAIEVWLRTPGMRGSLGCWVCQSRARSLASGTIVSPISSTLGTAAKAIGEVVVSNGVLMLAKKDQAPPDLRYFKQLQK